VIPGYTSDSFIFQINIILFSDVQRILFIVPWMVMGGADRFNFEFTEYFTKSGWDFTVVATLSTHHTWLDKFAELTSDIFILPNFLSFDRANMIMFLMYLIHSRQPDVVMVSNSEIGYSALPLLYTSTLNMENPPG
jgi:hypothetical protein